MKPRSPPLQSARLLDQVRERVRYLHYSLSTEKTYLYWVRFFIRWSARGGTMRHPRDMGAPEVEAFLSMLATERRVSASTHNQALSALLFLYREVLAVELPWLDGVNRPAQKKRIPSVLTREEVAGLLAHMDGQVALIARLLYGTGMRLMEGIRTVQELLGHSDVSTTMMGFWGQSPNSPSLAARPQGAVLRTAVKLASDPNNPAAGGTASPLDALLAGV